jgi:prevent-host-death family protein
LTNLVKLSIFNDLNQRGKMAGHKRKKPRGIAEPIGLYDAKTRLSELVDEAAAGRAFTISKSGKPMARLVPLAEPDLRKLRKPGGAKGRIWIAEDFDAPLPAAIQRLFAGETS